MHIHTRTFGDGPRNVLAIHCSLAHSGAWRGVAAALSDEARFLAFDMPCHGKSEDWQPQMGDLHDVVTDAALNLIDTPVDIVGHSFGATVALRVACLRPEMVRSVVSFESVWFAAAALNEPDRIAAYSDRNKAFESAMDAGDRMTAARSFNIGWGDGSVWDSIPEKTRQYMADRIHFVRASSPFVVNDAPDLLGSGLIEKLQCPVLLIQGEHTDDTIDAVNAALSHRLPNSRRQTLEGVGHMAPVTDPLPVADAIRAFWDAQS